jgi:hypothetical protein
MASETAHFVEAVALDRSVLVTPEQARQVMELYIAADLSAQTNEPTAPRQQTDELEPPERRSSVVLSERCHAGPETVADVWPQTPHGWRRLAGCPPTG